MKVLLFRTHHGDPLCAAIAALTRGQYTHAAVLVDEAHNGIIEAFYPKVRPRTLDNSELSGIDVFDLPAMSAGEEAAALAFFSAHIGEPYSIGDLLRFLPFWRAFAGEENEAAATQHCFCSMFVFEGIKAAGIHLLERVEGCQVCPNTLSYSPLLVAAPPLKPL